MYWSDTSGNRFAPNPILMALFERAHQEKMEELRALNAAKQMEARANLLNAQSLAALRPSQAQEALAHASYLQAQAQAMPAYSNYYNAHARLFHEQADDWHAKTHVDPNLMANIVSPLTNMFYNVYKDDLANNFTLPSITGTPSIPQNTALPQPTGIPEIYRMSTPTGGTLYTNRLPPAALPPLEDEQKKNQWED